MSNDIREGLKALPSRNRENVEKKLLALAQEILECLERNVTRKAIRDFLGSNGIKVSPTKFKSFLETHVLPKMQKTSSQALANARAMAQGRQE